MTPDLLPFALLFVALALVTGLGTSALLARTSPERRRLREMTLAGAGGPNLPFARPADATLVEQLDPRLEGIARRLPKSPAEMGRLRRRLATAGLHSYRAAVLYCLAEVSLPVLFAAAALSVMAGSLAWLGAGLTAMIGYLLPRMVLGRLITKQKRRLEDGLPDALDLMVVCVEAGCGLDQAILKTSAELEISHPALAAELATVTAALRAGKPRVEAFKGLADRTKVDDLRALVAMLVQTDRFGTSVSQALRTHAATSRTKRRQRAEERGAKIGAKLVFPLVFLLFPAFYVVTLGPAVIQFVRIFFKLELGG